MIPGTDPLLSVFPPPLLRLVLCGGGGLPAAWGPLISAADADAGIEPPLQWPWDPTEARVHPKTWRGDDKAMMYPNSWRLPLDHWRARLSVVAAWMLGQPTAECNYWAGFLPRFAWLDSNTSSINLWFVVDRAMDAHAQPRDGCAVRYTWSRDDGRCMGYHAVRLALDLPTLPRHLLTHDPHIALLHALFDVPEIRARVEALNV